MRSVHPMIFYNISGGSEDHHKADGTRQTAAHWSGRLSKIPRTWSSNWKRAKEGDLSTRRCARSFGKAAHSSANLAWEGCGLGSGPHTGPDGSAAHGEEEGASMWAPFSTSRLTLANQIRISCDTVSIFRALSVFSQKKKGHECIFWKFRWYLKPNARIENAFYSWIYI